jgi:hypothetical protein
VNILSSLSMAMCHAQIKGSIIHVTTNQSIWFLMWWSNNCKYSIDTQNMTRHFKRFNNWKSMYNSSKNQMTKQINFEIHFFHFETKSHLDVELVRSEIKLQSCNSIMKQVIHLHLALLFPKYVSRRSFCLDL